MSLSVSASSSLDYAEACDKIVSLTELLLQLINEYEEEVIKSINNGNPIDFDSWIKRFEPLTFFLAHILRFSAEDLFSDDIMSSENRPFGSIEHLLSIKGYDVIIWKWNKQLLLNQKTSLWKNLFIQLLLDSYSSNKRWLKTTERQIGVSSQVNSFLSSDLWSKLVAN